MTCYLPGWYLNIICTQFFQTTTTTQIVSSVTQFTASSHRISPCFLILQRISNPVSTAWRGVGINKLYCKSYIINYPKNSYSLCIRERARVLRSKCRTLFIQVEYMDLATWWYPQLLFNRVVHVRRISAIVISGWFEGACLTYFMRPISTTLLLCN